LIVTRRVRFLATVCACLAAIAVSAAQQATSLEAASLERKLAAVAARANGNPPQQPPTPMRTLVTEREVNAYLKFSARDQLPTGLVNPEITLVGDRRVSGRATVDLDAVRTSEQRGWLDPAAYLGGTVEVRATGILHTANGKGTFQVESASVGSLPMPKSLLQELVSYYSKTPELPAGFELDKPFDLPANIREVEIQRGAATIVQ
jgi:hypothetical protein